MKQKPCAGAVTQGLVVSNAILGRGGFCSGAGTNLSENIIQQFRWFSHRIHGTGIFTYIYHKNQPNVGKYTIHGSYGFGIGIIYPEMIGFAAKLMVSFPFVLIMLRWKMMENGLSSKQSLVLWDPCYPFISTSTIVEGHLNQSVGIGIGICKHPLLCQWLKHGHLSSKDG